MSKPQNSKNKDFSRDLLRRFDGDGEFFTVKKTGRSGMSQRGLARFINKHNTSIGYWVDKVRKANPMDNQLPEPLKPFAGKSLSLMQYNDPVGRDILEDRFCSALIEYFAWWAHDADKNTQSKRAFSLIRDVGMRQLIHLKTGWHSECSSEEFDQLLESHEQRVTARNILKDELRPELMEAVKEWQKANHASRKIYWQTHDALNEVIQGLKSRQIKANNNLPKSALIRDYYDTRPLIDYASLSRPAANLIRCGIHPLEAVKLAASLCLSTAHNPEPIPLIENIHKVSKLLEDKKQAWKLRSKNQFQLPDFSDS